MPKLSAKDVDSILEISGLAQECASESQFPAVLFQRMTDLFGSKSAVFYSMGDNLGGSPLWDGFGFKVDAEMVRRYERRYLAVDPCFNGLRRRAALGRKLIVSTDQAIDNERSYIASEYYQDFLRPQNIHSSMIFGVGDRQGTLGLFGFHRSRGKPHYSEQERIKAQLFAAQIAYGLRLRQLTNNSLRLRAVARKLMAQGSVRHYLVLDQDFHVIDSAGDAMKNLGLGGSDLVMVDEAAASVERHLPPEICGYVRNVLLRRANDQSADEMLKTFDNLHGAGRIRVDLLQSDGQPPLVLVIFLAPDAELISESRLSAFGLTPKERDIVHQICRGLTTLQMAGELGISVKTVEHHITHIYKKTQVCNRTELIRQLSF